MAKIPVNRTQLMLARKIWQRPHLQTARVVQHHAQVALEEEMITRDEKEVLDILVETLERSCR